MIKLLRQLLILSILLPSLGTEAKAAFDSGNELYSECASSDDLHYGLCVGYVKGIGDAGDHEAPLLDMRGGVISGFQWCMHRGITVKQALLTLSCDTFAITHKSAIWPPLAL
jgi:hypothetical protein